jgi:segregation and condensation protein A
LDPAPYTVALDVFHGPLDLLLYLIKRDELDIYDIPIARITDSFLQHVALLRELDHAAFDLGTAGEFLVVAATLMEIKSATLLPPPPATDDTGEPTAAQQLADPRFELVQQLLEYKRFKDVGSALEQQQRRHEARFPRWPAKLGDEGADEPPPVDLDEIQMWDLLAAFDRLMRETGTRRPRYHEVTYDDTPIDLHAADIEDRLGREGKLTLRSLIVGRRSRSEMAGVFLALLELIREKRVLVNQPEPLGEVEIEIAPDEHRRTYVGASLHLSQEGEDAASEPVEDVSSPS